LRHVKFSLDTGACIAIVSITTWFNVIVLGDIWDKFKARRFGLALRHQSPCPNRVHEPPIGRAGVVQPAATPLESRSASVRDTKEKARSDQRKRRSMRPYRRWLHRNSSRIRLCLLLYPSHSQCAEREPSPRRRN